jgi:hypothetical protein
MVKSFNREEAIGKIYQQKYDECEDYLEFEAFISNKKSNQVGNRQLRQNILKTEYQSPSIGKIESPSQKKQEQ